MAVTSRSAFLERQVTALTADAEAGRARGEPDALVESQLDDAKDRLARVQAQLKEWEVRPLVLWGLAAVSDLPNQFDNALRRHNFIGLVRFSLWLPSIPALNRTLTSDPWLVARAREAEEAGPADRGREGGDEAKACREEGQGQL